MSTFVTDKMSCIPSTVEDVSSPVPQMELEPILQGILDRVPDRLHELAIDEESGMDPDEQHISAMRAKSRNILEEGEDTLISLIASDSQIKH